MRAEMDEIKCDKIVPGTSFLLLKCKLTVILTLTVARSIHSLYLLLPPPPPSKITKKSSLLIMRNF